MSDRPIPLKLRPEHVPQTLKDIPQWVGYRLEWDEGKQRYDKVPRVIRDGRALKIARTNVRDDWTTFDAVAAVSTTPARVGHVDGPGIVMTADLGLIAVDLDNCVTSGIISPEAKAILTEIDSYSEQSPSGTGIRIFVRATLPITKRVKDWIQVNASVGYLTVTGQHILGTPTTVEDRQAAVEAWFVKVFGSTGGTSTGGAPVVVAVRQASSPILDDDELLGIARGAKNGDKFRKLYDEGDTSGYASESEAHLALVNMLVFYTHGDADQTQRLVLSSALGKHEKWQRPDYFARTLDRATLTPTHKITLLTNHRPEIKGGDHAIWRRIHLVPFGVRFWRDEDPNPTGEVRRQDRKVIKDMAARLRAESEGILAWMVRGCSEWQRVGLKPPQRVIDATAEYRAAEDVFTRWVDERCETGSQYEATAKTLYEDHEQWCGETNERAISRKMFSRRLNDRGCVRRESHGNTHWSGLRLRAG